MPYSIYREHGFRASHRLAPTDDDGTMQILKRRHSIRLPGYDYTRAGAYFVTICTHERQCLLGEIIEGELHLNEIGKIVEQTWLETSEARSLVELDVYVVMPNHFHGIIVIHDDVDGRTDRQGDGIQAGSVGAIMAQFKSLVTKRAKALRAHPNGPLWQRNYYDHIIRDEDDLNRIREYITFNPERWLEDQNNPTVFQKKNP